MPRIAKLISVILAVALAVRLLAAMNDLWLDELISRYIALYRVKNAWDVFATVHFDNNHYLNTLYMWMLGDVAYWPLYRMLSVLTGVGAVWAGWWVAKERSERAGLLMAVMIAASYPLIHFSSEARGYSGAVFMALLAYGTMERWLRQPRWSLLILYNVATILGVLFHLTFCFVLLALAFWSLVEVFVHRGWRGLGRWALMHAGAAVLIGILWWVDLRHMGVLSGTVSDGLAPAMRMFVLAAGWPLRDTWSGWGIMAGMAGAMAYMMWRLWRRKAWVWVFFILLFAVPIGYVLLARPTALYSRYFLVLVPFIYVLAAMGLARANWRVAAGVMALFAAGQAVLMSQFLRVGRGNGSEAVRLMARESAEPVITVASDQDFRATVEMDYFRRFLPAGRQIVMVKREQQAKTPAEWYLYHDEGTAPPGPEVITTSNGVVLDRMGFFPCSELSGQAWTLYRRRPE